jgi:hypothetical protein
VSSWLIIATAFGGPSPSTLERMMRKVRSSNHSNKVVPFSLNDGSGKNEALDI